MPNAPPTSGATVRTRRGSSPRARAMSSLARCGVWVPVQTVSRCTSPSHRARDARDSNGAGATRGCRTVTSAVAAAPAKARSGSPWRQCPAATALLEISRKSGAPECFLGVADRFQRLDIHLDPIRRRERRRLGLGDDGDDRLAHGTKLSRRQDRHVGRIDVPEDRVDGGPKQSFHVAAGVDAGDARHRSRRIHAQVLMSARAKGLRTKTIERQSGSDRSATYRPCPVTCADLRAGATALRNRRLQHGFPATRRTPSPYRCMLRALRHSMSRRKVTGSMRRYCYFNNRTK